MIPAWIRAYRLIFGLAALIAVTWNLQHFNDPDFWKFFTNQSSLLAGVVLVLGALLFAKFRNPFWWDVIRGVAVIAMLVTGIVYALLLDGIYNPFTTSDHTWASSVMHQLMPIVMLIDILIVPLSPRTPRWSVGFYLIYPLTYLGYFLITGRNTEWYPYDFVDHRTYDNGYTGVFITSGALVLVFVLIGLALIGYSRVRRIPVDHA
ncbi:MAG: Pr6Pr family membrane protein [Thermomicrobiales bacterium]|nr:Pr6Pr family membrane protein [Thermomicrobiales bacterium]MCO5225096.1 Pr6Pr family membrane protein [Thermomicrobiales bacterium]